MTLAGPRSTQIDLILDAATSTPVRISAAQGSGHTVLTATYAPFEERDDGIHVPTRIEVEVPSLELMLDVRYKSWEVLDEVPAVFDLSAPEGWSTEPLEWAFLRP